MTTDQRRNTTEGGPGQRAETDEPHGLTVVLGQLRRRLRQLISRRFDQRLAGRVDASDLAQDALVEFARDLQGNLAEQDVPWDVRLRAMSRHQLTRAKRRHLHTRKRDARLEVDAVDFPQCFPSASPDETPSACASRHENAEGLHQRLQQLGDSDREILTLRYLENFSILEVAALLRISENAVKLRLFRARQRLRQLFDSQDDSPHDSGTDG